MSCEEWLREEGLLILEKEGFLRNLTASPSVRYECYGKEGARLFIVVQGGKMGNERLKFKTDCI